MNRRIDRLNMFALSLVAAPIALAGPEWVEIGDAGSLPNTAQKITGTGSSTTSVRGTLNPGSGAAGSGGDAQDMYMVQITEPQVFYVSTSPHLGGSAEFDTQLWIFEVEGGGLLGNNNTWVPKGGGNQGSTIWSASNDGTQIVITEPGLYLFAISTVETVPASDGGPMFFFFTPTEVSGPDGPGGQLPIIGWHETEPPGRSRGEDPIEYFITMAGAAPVPTLAAGLDINPGTCPNLFNPASNGHTKVAILGAADLNVHDINLSTIRMSRVDGQGTHVSINQRPKPKYKDISQPYTGGDECGCQSEGADGFFDLQVKFKGWAMREALQLGGLPIGTDVPLRMIGELNDGTPFEAFDCIRISN